MMIAFLALNWLSVSVDNAVNSAVAATSSNVAVSASITDSIVCQNSTTTVVFGTINSAAVYTPASSTGSNVSSSMSCASAGNGCTLYVNDTGSGAGNPGLWNSSASKLIGSASAAFAQTATLVAGTEGYGIQATTTAAGSGTALGVPARYAQIGTAVGGFNTTSTIVASSTAWSTGKEILSTYKVAAAATTNAGSYADTVTYSCLSN